MTTRLTAAFAVTSLAWAAGASAQQQSSAAREQMVGVWTLVSAINTGADGVPRTGSFGPNPSGRLIFETGGYYVSVSTHSDLPKFASGNRLKGTAEENRAIVHGSTSTFGTWQVSADGKVLVLKIEGGTWPHWYGTEQNRELKISGDDMSYSLASSRGGRSTLTWKRVK